jgi:PKD repeat protein
MKPYFLFGVFLLLVSEMTGQSCNALFTFGSTNLTIHFTDQSTHAVNDPIVSWDWDFDDGGSSSQQNPTHTFPEPDKYDVVLTITTQNGCSSDLEIRIEICDFGVTYTTGACNAQGNVSVSINIADLFDNANEIDVILDGQSVPGSPFEIDAENPVNLQVMVPGNGQQHTILIQSTDIETCGRTITFSVEDCSSDCFLSGLNAQFPAGVTHNVQVNGNFFSPQTTAIVLGDVVHFTWADGGHSSTSDANSGPDSWNSGVIGAGSTFDVNIHQPGTHNFYCIPHGGPNGVGMSGQILSNCPSGTSMNLQVNFTTTVANAQGYQVLWDNVQVPGSPFNYIGTGNQTKTISIAGDGMTHQLIVRDVADPSCDIELMYDAPDCNQGGGNPVCSISGTLGNFGGCNNMNVSATLTVTVANGGSGFLVSIDNGPNTAHTYTGNSTNVTITLPGDGNNHIIEITDNADPACTTSLNVTTPDCNLPCSITNLNAIAASGSGGPSGITHVVNVQGLSIQSECHQYCSRRSCSMELDWCNCSYINF